MHSNKTNDYSNFYNFIKLQENILEYFSIEPTISKSVLQVEKLFRFFGDNFEEFRQKEHFSIVLAYTHHFLKEWISHENYLEENIGLHLIKLIQHKCQEESDTKISLQIVYQVLHSIICIGNDNVIISEDLLNELLLLLQAIGNQESVANCIACIHIYLELFPGFNQGLLTLWTYVKSQIPIKLNNKLNHQKEVDILIHFIDKLKELQPDLEDEPIIIITVQSLLKSEERKFRKCGYYLFKKVVLYFIENVNNVSKMWISTDHMQQIKQSWMLYITMMESLEEQQSHLILPSLENIKELINNKQMQSSWLNILFARILTHNNSLVLRWSVEFFLRTFSCSDLSVEILKHLLQATNSNILFNYEGYILKKDDFNSFLKGDITILIKLLSEIDNWKSVPLFVWLENLNKAQLTNALTFEDILNISSSVRKLQNCVIRKLGREVCHKLFADFIEKMTIEEYVTYIETIHNPSDIYEDHHVFFSKKSSLIQSTADYVIFKQRFYEIFTNSNWNNCDLISFLKDIPIDKHGWLKFAPLKLEIAQSDQNLVSSLSGVNFGNKYVNIHEVITFFRNSMLGSPPYDKNELIESTKVAISFYIYRKKNFNSENDDTLRFIMNTGFSHNRTLNVFAKKLCNINHQPRIDIWFIDELLKYKTDEMFECVSRYVCAVYDEDVIEKYAKIIFELSNFTCTSFPERYLIKIILDYWLNMPPSVGDKRIEEAFLFNHFGDSHFCQRQNLFSLITHYAYDSLVLDLLKQHVEITRKNPRYFENSKEHRVKLRIAISIFYSEAPESADLLDQMWNILLNESNQLNIVYIYEYIIGVEETRVDVVLNYLKHAPNLTSSQQVSIISVAYYFFSKRESTYHRDKEATYSLLSLTMGPNFQTRLWAQLCLYKLLKDLSIEKIEDRQSIMQSIESAIGSKFNEYFNDFRLLKDNVYVIETILYVTNAPHDEVFRNEEFSDYLKKDSASRKQIEWSRLKYLNKFKVSQNEDTKNTGTINYQIQRKMNPVKDLTVSPNLIAYPIKENPVEMIVVSSLIDKLPNLGGIARTCEVLGIKNLVMDSKMDIEKNEFKNLSMTAEKSLHILQVKPNELANFLIGKKLQGYTIIGAEQTSESENFDNFKFPQKCVLLLGHEKDGIPAPLLALLDKAVEIPQLGQVRSLNVHVTAALFMWEYCKQHLIQK